MTDRTAALCSRISLVLALAACSDDPATTTTDTSTSTDIADTTSADVTPDTTTPADTLTPADTTTPADTSAPVDTTPLEDLGPAPDASEVPLTIDWHVESASTEGDWAGATSTLALADGGFVITGVFSGSFTLGDRVVRAEDDDRYTNMYLARFDADDALVALNRLCDVCRGVLAERPGGLVATSAVDDNLVVTRLTLDGELVDSATVATFPDANSGAAPTTIVATPDGGFVVGGSSFGLSIAGGPTFIPDDGWHYPGRAFVVGVDADLHARYAEAVGGAAGSSVSMLAVSDDSLVVVGDFGGYPPGVPAVFGPGQPEPLTLPSVSSDDDPAMDIFVARFALPAAAGDVAPSTVARPTLTWAKRIAQYGDIRRPTFLATTGPDLASITWRIDRAASLTATDDGHYAIARDADYHDNLVVSIDATGAVTPRFTNRTEVVPTGGSYLGLADTWNGQTLAPLGPDGPTYDVPAVEPGPDGRDYLGLALARVRADGAPIAAGFLLEHFQVGRYGLAIEGVVPRAADAAILVMRGSTPVTLAPSPGAGADAQNPLIFDHDGYERLVLVRVALH